jgi:hypothetical protein
LPEADVDIGGIGSAVEALLLLRQSFLILFTDINVALFDVLTAAVTTAGSGSPFKESAEKRLVVVPERARPCTGGGVDCSGRVCPLPMVIVSH